MIDNYWISLVLDLWEFLVSFYILIIVYCTMEDIDLP